MDLDAVGIVFLCVIAVCVFVVILLLPSYVKYLRDERMFKKRMKTPYWKSIAVEFIKAEEANPRSKIMCTRYESRD